MTETATDTTTGAATAASTTIDTAVPIRRIGILLFDQMEELDAVGPWEVFAWWTRHFPEDGYAVTTFSPDGAAVTCEKGLVISASHSMATVPDLEVLLHPGGDGTQRLRADENHLRWLRDQRERVPLLASVCTGSTVFAAGGLLRRRPATSNHAALDQLRRLDQTIDVHADVPYVDDGDVVTSAGIAAGIEMALHLVGRFAGADRERQVREGIEYHPAPTPARVSSDAASGPSARRGR